ncbi:MAG TPA: MCE family protein [Arcobacter sp.]|jgi:paraquat-inducible protein B|nr:MCE family protein [Arcobacter sp.]
MEKLKERKMYKKPKVRQKKSILVLAWIVPIVALLISFGMMKDYFDQRGQSITILVNDVQGLNVRKSHIEYRGVKIGKLNSIKPDPYNLEKFIISAQIYKEFNYFIKKGTQFYVVKSNIGIDKIENIGTVLTGNYIELIPPTTNSYYLSNLPKETTFQALDEKPKNKGMFLNLKSKNGTLNIGTKVVFNGVQIGEIVKKLLLKELIEYKIVIYKKYQYLLTNESYFYIQNPVELSFTQEKLDFKIAPFKDMFFGLITLINDKKLKSIDKNWLYESLSELYYKKEKGFNITLKSDVIGKDEKLYFKGIEIGKVTDIFIQDSQKYAKLFVKEQFKKYITINTKFYKQSAIKTDIGLDGINIDIPSIKEIVFGGISFDYEKGDQNLEGNIFNLYLSKDEIKQIALEKEFFDITIKLNDLDNIKTSSNIFLNNVPIGKVKEIYLDELTPTVIVSVENKYKKFFGSDSKIYVEGIQVSLSKVKNLSLEVLGDKFILIPSEKSGLKKEYYVTHKNPIDSIFKEGKRFIIKSSDAKDLSINTPIFYKYTKIGNIEKIDLNTRTDDIELHLFIEQKYMKYINEDTLFYQDKTLNAKFGLFDSKVEIGSMKTFFQGGINIGFMYDLDENTEIINKDKNGFFIFLKEDPFFD